MFWTHFDKKVSMSKLTIFIVLQMQNIELDMFYKRKACWGKLNLRFNKKWY